MKHLYKTFFAFTTILLLVVLPRNAHTQTIDNSEDLMASVDLELIEDRPVTFDTKTMIENSESELKAKAEAYDQYVSKDFGTYLNPYNGTLNIRNDKATFFSKAQFLELSTNKNAFSIELDSELKTIDISNYKPGEYTLMLSNNKGDLFVENFIIL